MIDPRTVPVRFSNLKLMSQSAADYLDALQVERPDTSSYKLGRATHRLALEGICPVVYDGTRRGKEWEAFAAAQEGPKDDILNPREESLVTGMADSLRRHKRAMEVLQGVTERRFSWKLNGRECAGTPDIVLGNTFVSDLKTTKSAHPEKFKKDARWYGYHAQLAWYMNGIRLAGLGDPKEAYLVAVEAKRPHPVTVLHLTEAAIEHGTKLYRAWWEQLMVCEASGVWGGYSESDVEFDIEGDEMNLIINGEEVEIT